MIQNLNYIHGWIPVNPKFQLKLAQLLCKYKLNPGPFLVQLERAPICELRIRLFTNSMGTFPQPSQLSNMVQSMKGNID